MFLEAFTSRSQVFPKFFFDSLNENHSECPNNILEQNGMELNGTLPSEEVNEVTMDQLRASQVS